MNYQRFSKPAAHDIAARRLMAIALLETKDPTDKQKSTALENAELAAQLGGDEDWLSHVALALAQAAHGAPAKHTTRPPKPPNMPSALVVNSVTS